MMNMKKIGWFSLILCLFLVSCKKDEVVDPVNPVDPEAYEIPVKEVFAPMSGIVFNEAGSPIAGALVKVGASSKITDDNGIFNFENATLNEYGSPVNISKAGYFETVQMVNGKAGKRSDIRVMLLEKTIIGSVMANVGGTLTANGNSKITLPANGIIDEAGNAYSGEVKVAAKWLDPTAQNLNEMMPGDLRAISTDQELVQLASYGMLGVELEGSAGEALNIAEGSVANLEFPVPAALQGGAPATIPLWTFNETTGYWEEEGQATFDGQKYVGEVSHFSFWNVDAKFPVVCMEGSLIDKDGNPLVGYQVKIEINSSALCSWGYTDANGVFSGKIPKDEEMTLTVRYYGLCNTDIHSEVIGPFSDDVVLSPITINFNNGIGWNLNLSGMMEDCNSDVVTRGYVNVTYDGGSFTMFPDPTTGAIAAAVYFCTDVSSVELEAFDTEGQKTGAVTSFAVMEGTDLDFGTLSVCETVTESINFTIDGIDYFIFDPSARVDTSTVIISAYGLDSSSVYLQITASVPILTNPDYANFTGVDNNGVSSANCSGATTGCMDFEVDLTQFPNVGGQFIGTFNGTMPGTGPGGVSTVTGSFVIDRDL